MSEQDFYIFWMDEKGKEHRSEMFPTTYSRERALHIIRWEWTDYSKRRYFAKNKKGTTIDPWDVIHHVQHLGEFNCSFQTYYPEEK